MARRSAVKTQRLASRCGLLPARRSLRRWPARSARKQVPGLDAVHFGHSFVCGPWGVCQLVLFPVLIFFGRVLGGPRAELPATLGGQSRRPSPRAPPWVPASAPPTRPLLQ